MENKIIELAQKLKALADRGVGGEKENALQMLERLMAKHGITYEMLGEDKIVCHEIFLPAEDWKFFTQVAASVCGDDYRAFKYTYKINRKHINRGKERYGIECKEHEFIEVMARYGFYVAKYNEDLDIFYSAFIQKNRLYKKPKDTDDDEEDSTPLTREERERLMRMAMMMEGLERHNFSKGIGSGK